MEEFDINAKDKAGKTAYDYATTNSSWTIMEMLEKANARTTSTTESSDQEASLAPGLQLPQTQLPRGTSSASGAHAVHATPGVPTMTVPEHTRIPSP